MSCRRTKRMISRYIDDELATGERESFLEHIGKCPACSRELEEASAVHQLFTGAERSPAPYGFTARVMAGISREDAPRKWSWDFIAFRPFLPRFAEAAFTIAVMALGIVAGSQLVLDRAAPQDKAGIEEVFSLDVFQATPPDSIGGAYANIMEAGDEG
jgi:anti-sigma factor RsiW